MTNPYSASDKSTCTSDKINMQLLTIFYAASDKLTLGFLKIRHVSKCQVFTRRRKSFITFNLLLYDGSVYLNTKSHYHHTKQHHVRF